MVTNKVLIPTALVCLLCPSGVMAEVVIQVGRDVRTITEAIARQPQAGTVIQLAAGTYSTASGEVFPLRLPTGVILRGNVANRGASVIINGGGRYISPTFADQNIAILAGKNGVIEGVTVTNPNRRGYGIWVESKEGVQIRHNTFTGNVHDGVFLTGNAQGVIADNLFVGNTGSGLSAVGSSRGEIVNNLFENTGFGLSIGQKSQVRLTGNRIVNNVDGIVITHEAQPVLRNNVIEGSTRDGVVIVADRDRSPRPDLGTTASNGNNIFRNNRQHDIHNLGTIPIMAVGNQVNPSRVKGRVEFTVATRFPSSLNPPTSVPSSGSLRFPDSLRNKQTPSKTIIIERSAPIPPRPALVLDPRTGQPMRFRVVVPIASDADLARIRTVIPDAFRSFRDGRMVAQIGAYSDRTDADNQAQKVVPLGYQAVITDF